MRSGTRALDGLRRQLAALEAEPLEDDEQADPAVFDWFADGCPCGIEPGECTTHHRARPAQRPPTDPDWLVFFMMCGRGTGKTRSASQIVHRWAAEDPGRLIGVVGPTIANTRDVQVKGPSGLLRTAPPWARPTWKKSEREIRWPNGATAIYIGAEEADRLAGFNFSRVWCDELCLWSNPREAWDQIALATRDGADVKIVVTTTPRPSSLLREILERPTTRLTRESTFANARHLAPAFIEHVREAFGDSRKGQQELYGEVLDVAAGAWFDRFNASKYVTTEAAYNPHRSTWLGIDAGSSRTTAAVLVQFERAGSRWRLTVVSDLLVTDGQSEKNARAIAAWLAGSACGGRVNGIFIDPASEQITPLGPVAFEEYKKVFPGIQRAPRTDNIADRLDELEVLMDRGDLLLHPDARNMKASFQNYAREVRGGEPMNRPKSNQSPWEDPMDALRYVVRGVFNDGIAVPQFKGRNIHVSHLFR